MKTLITVIGLLVFILNSSAASAWTHWYYAPNPYGPAQAPYANTTGLYMYNQLPTGQFQSWSMNFPILPSGIYVEQIQFPTEYLFRIYPGNHRLQDIHITLEEGALVVRNKMQSLNQYGQSDPYMMKPPTGGFTQWMLLPEDAIVGMMHWSVNNGVLEISIPKSH